MMSLTLTALLCAALGKVGSQARQPGPGYGHSTACARGCLCLQGGSVACSGRNLRQGIPQNLPLDMTRFRMVDADIQVIHKYAFSRFKHLRIIDIRRTRLVRIEQHAFRGMDSIEKIFINENHRLAELEPGAFGYLNNSRAKKVILQRNAIRTLQRNLFEYSANFQVIDFRMNPGKGKELKSHAFSHLYNVGILYAPEHIQTIQPDAFNGLIGVHLLTIAYWTTLTGTKHNTFNGLRRLKQLRIESGSLGKVVEGTFAGMVDVEDVYIHNGELSYLSAKSLASIRNIRAFHVQITYIQHADISLRPLIQYGMLNLSGSKIDCVCHNLWLLSKDSGMTVRGLKATTCHNGPWHERDVWSVRQAFVDYCMGGSWQGMVRRSLGYVEDKAVMGVDGDVIELPGDNGTLPQTGGGRNVSSAIMWWVTILWVWTAYSG